jgi:hypothetical protein
MFKVEKIKSSLDCDVCKKLLVDPMVMSCGKFFCKSHLTQLIINNKFNRKNTFICGICQEEHFIPKNGFKINDRLQELLELRLNEIKPSAMFEECKKELEKAKENEVKTELLKKNAEKYTYDYFEDIKRQVVIRRDNLKIKIDKYSEEIIKSVELNQKNYIKLSKEVNKITENIEKSKKDLNELISRFDTLEFNDEKFKDIKISVAAVNQEFHKMLAVYQDSLIGNKEYTFDFKESPIEDIFGRVTDVQVNL